MVGQTNDRANKKGGAELGGMAQNGMPRKTGVGCYKTNWWVSEQRIEKKRKHVRVHEKEKKMHVQIVVRAFRNRNKLRKKKKKKLGGAPQRRPGWPPPPAVGG